MYFGINVFESVTLVFLTNLLETSVYLAFKALLMFVKSWEQMALRYLQESSLLGQLMKLVPTVMFIYGYNNFDCKFGHENIKMMNFSLLISLGYLVVEVEMKLKDLFHTEDKATVAMWVLTHWTIFLINNWIIALVQICASVNVNYWRPKHHNRWTMSADTTRKKAENIP